MELRPRSAHKREAFFCATRSDRSCPPSLPTSFLAFATGTRSRTFCMPKDLRSLHISVASPSDYALATFLLICHAPLIFLTVLVKRESIVPLHLRPRPGRVRQAALPRRADRIACL